MRQTSARRLRRRPRRPPRTSNKTALSFSFLWSGSSSPQRRRSLAASARPPDSQSIASIAFRLGDQATAVPAREPRHRTHPAVSIQRCGDIHVRVGASAWKGLVESDSSRSCIRPLKLRAPASDPTIECLAFNLGPRTWGSCLRRASKNSGPSFHSSRRLRAPCFHPCCYSLELAPGYRWYCHRRTRAPLRRPRCGDRPYLGMSWREEEIDRSRLIRALHYSCIALNTTQSVPL